MSDTATGRAGDRSAALRRVARNAPLRRVVIVSGGFNIAELGSWIALTLVAFRFGGVSEASKLLVAELLPATVAALCVGSLIARWGTTRVLAAGFAMQSAGLGIAAIALEAGSPRVVVYGGAVLAAISMVSTRPAIASALPTMVEKPDGLTAANVVIGWVTAGATVVGPLVVAMTIDIGSGALTIALFALVTAASCLIAWTLPTFRPRPDAALAGRWGLLAAMRAGSPMLAVIVLGVCSLVLGCLDLLYVVIGVDVLGGEPSLAGWLNTAAGIGALFGGAAAVVLLGRRTLWPWLVAGGVFSATGLAVLGASGGPVVAALIFAAIQLGLVFLVITARTLLQRLSDLDLLGHLAAIAESAEMGTLLLGAILLPAFVHWFSPTGAAGAVGVLLLFTIAACSVLIARAERAQRAPIERLELLRSCHLFALLPSPTIETLARAATSVQLGDGEVLFREGEAGDHYYVVASGEVLLTQHGQRLASVVAGGGFGELALRHEIGRAATATASGEVELLAVDGPTFLFAVTGDPATLRRVVEVSAAHGHEQP